MALKLITFDITGTLLILRETVGQVYSRVACKQGITVPPDALTLSFSIAFKRMLIDHPNFGESGIGWPEWWNKLVNQTFQESLPESQKKKFDATKCSRISSELIELYKTKECWMLANGAEDLLLKLAGENVHLGVISNYDPRLDDILENLNVKKYFKFVMTSYRAKCEKPALGIFQTVENMFPCINKSEILHVGDNLKLDFYGAKSVGWNALLVAKDNSRVKNDHTNIENEWVVTKLSNIYPFLISKKYFN